MSYQEINGVRVPVESRYVLEKRKRTQYGFAVGSHRRGHELIIDPGLDYSTFVGGSSMDRADDVAVDANGNAIVVGATQSTDFPTTPGAVGPTFRGGIMDAFVAKLNADGSRLVYATYLGGTPTPTRRGDVDHVETGRAVTVDANGNAYVTGQTSSGDFPITGGAFQPDLGVGVETATDGFVTKLSPTGGLVYSTFLGGAASDDGRSIAVDASGNAYVGGSTFAGDFPTTAGAFDTVHAGGATEDAFVTKLNPTGSALVYSTFLGGADTELPDGIAIDASGDAYLSGSTRSVEFPTTAGSFQPNHSGGEFAELFEGFITKLNPTGSGLAYSTFLGGTEIDRVGEVAIDSAGNAYVVGGTLSPTFPTTPGAFDPVFDSTGDPSTGAGPSEGFVTKLNAAGSDLAYSTFFEGAGSITLDAANNAWLAGGAEAGAPTTADAFQPQNNGGSDAYIAQLNDTGSQILYATYLGGTDNEGASGIALDPNENIYIAGTTISADFPTTPGAFDRLFGGDPAIFWGDAFVAKFGDGATPEPEPPPAEFTTTTFSGRIDKNRTATHNLAIEAVGRVDVTLDWDETRANLMLRARDPSGNVVFFDGSSAKPKRGTFSATVTGTYRFEVINNSDRQPRYTLSVTHPVPSSSSDTTAPTVSVSSPTSGSTVSGTVSITAAASDNVGVRDVRFFVDGTQIASDSTAPYGTQWDTTTVADGSHVLTATAFDAAGNSGSSAPVTVTVNNPAPTATLSSLGLSPTSVTGGTSSQGTVTLTSAAPTGGLAVSLSSTNTAVATVPAGVTVPAGATSANFTVSTNSVSSDTSVMIQASAGGVIRTATLTVNVAAPTTDTVSISRAEYEADKDELRVEASSSDGSATLRVFVSATNELIGTLSEGKGQFSWPTNPQNVTVRSSLGGSATRAVTLK